MNTPRTTLYRDKHNAKLMGVCSGIADYTGIDAFWVAREIRANFRDIDRRLASVEAHYVSSNPRLTAEIERLR